MRARRILLLICFPSLVLTGLALGQSASSRQGFASFRAEDLRRHLEVLASDSMEGRETATQGQWKAAAYIASMFQSFGLKPVGSDGSYFQKFDVAIRSLDPHSSVVMKVGDNSTTFAYGSDFLALTETPFSLAGPVVFIGFMDSPLDSLQARSLEGSFVMAFAGRRSDAGLSSGTRRRRLFGRQFPRSLGTIVVFDEREGKTFEENTAYVRSEIERGSMSLASEPETPKANRPPILYISMASAIRLLQSTGQDAAQWRERALREPYLPPVILDRTELSINLAIRTTIVSTANVVGLLEGVDPSRRDEVVVLTAHYDHLGRTSRGQIFHGADDDGSGTSMLLELAEAFALNAARPARSVLFMALTGEEKGLLGSEYYVAHPVVALHQTCADLNIDMIGRVDDKHAATNTEHYVYVIGSDRLSTELDSLLQSVNNRTVRLNLDYTYNDARDPSNFYERSDHYNFARNGIPVVFFFTGIHGDYHSTTDTIDKIRFAKMVPIGQLIFETAWELAQLPRALGKNRAAAP